MNVNILTLSALIADLYEQLDAAQAERDGLAAKNAEMHEHIRVLEAERLPEETGG